jgi:hypothetical protein
MEMTSEQWIEWYLKTFGDWFTETGSLEGDGLRRFFENIVVEKRPNADGLPLIFRNDPLAIKNAVNYQIPVTDNEYLSFRFFVREKRYGNQEDRVWNQRRWDIVQQIVDSIEVTPRPVKF